MLNHKGWRRKVPPRERSGKRRLPLGPSRHSRARSKPNHGAAVLLVAVRSLPAQLRRFVSLKRRRLQREAVVRAQSVPDLV